MINYLARRVNPTPYVSFLPPELIMFGEERMLAALEAHPPDFIVLAPSNLTPFGYRGFGQDTAQKLWGWIVRNYAPVYPPPPDDPSYLPLLARVKPAQ